MSATLTCEFRLCADTVPRFPTPAVAMADAISGHHAQAHRSRQAPLGSARPGMEQRGNEQQDQVADDAHGEFGPWPDLREESTAGPNATDAIPSARSRRPPRREAGGSGRGSGLRRAAWRWAEDRTRDVSAGVRSERDAAPAGYGVGGLADARLEPQPTNLMRDRRCSVAPPSRSRPIRGRQEAM